MNRRQKRLFCRNAKSKGFSKNAIKSFVQIKEAFGTHCLNFKNGEKCKLRVDDILKAHPMDQKNKAYLDFVQSCRGKILTVTYDKNYLTPPIRLVCFQEDPSEIKFLFPTVYLEKITEGETK